MAVEKLYYQDSHWKEFTATVLGCEECQGGFAVTLDRTAFYPEGGGQAGDTGTLGAVRVRDTREAGEDIVHLCDGPLTVGEMVKGSIDWTPRFQRMQSHSGEHIVSGLIHSRFGYHNVGFHMGADCITIDFDGIIPEEALPELENAANAAVWANLPVKCWYPSEEELPQVFYRTKRALPWPVRIVQVPGFDSCACCGTHVKQTGEIGPIKLFSVVNFRSGSRMEMACGGQAFGILNEAYRQNKLVSQAFSAQSGETGAAAQRMNEVNANLKYRITGLEKRLFAAIAAGCAGKGDVLHFEEGLDGSGLRDLADAMAEVCGGTAAVFSGTEDTGYAYCLADREKDLRPLGKELNQKLQGRGGGKPHFLQGRVQAGKTEIEGFFAG